jgi:branched-chain amino acid transport system substrate-binding protein
MYLIKKLAIGSIALCMAVTGGAAFGGTEPAPIIVGLDADMSSGASLGGEAIRLGVVLAMDDINSRGGVLGRPLKLVIRDHRGIPARGVDNMEDFAKMDQLVAVVGGSHTPVALAELESIHRNKILYLGPWAAGTPIVANKYQPNYVFRVSVRDEHAGGFLIGAARDRGFKKPGLLLWRTGWGRSNEKAMKAALSRIGMGFAGVQWFNTGQQDITQQINALAASGADVIMLVAGPADGLVAIRNIADMPENSRLPVISHWGITGGGFFDKAPDDIAKVDLSFLQTISFFQPPFPDRAQRLYKAYCDKFGPCKSKADLRAPVGTAHAYDLIQMLGMAIKKAGSVDRAKIHTAMESLGRYEGLMRNYDPPFTATRHDALDARDFNLCRYDGNGAIVPVKPR